MSRVADQEMFDLDADENGRKALDRASLGHDKQRSGD